MGLNFLQYHGRGERGRELLLVSGPLSTDPHPRFFAFFFGGPPFSPLGPASASFAGAGVHARREPLHHGGVACKRRSYQLVLGAAAGQRASLANRVKTQ